MMIVYVVLGSISGTLAASVGMILFDLSFLWAALIYIVVGTLGILVTACICLLRTNDQFERSTPSPEKLDAALSRN